MKERMEGFIVNENILKSTDYDKYDYFLAAGKLWASDQFKNYTDEEEKIIQRLIQYTIRESGLYALGWDSYEDKIKKDSFKPDENDSVIEQFNKFNKIREKNSEKQISSGKSGFGKVSENYQNKVKFDKKGFNKNSKKRIGSIIITWDIDANNYFGLSIGNPYYLTMDKIDGNWKSFSANKHKHKSFKELCNEFISQTDPKVSISDISKSRTRLLNFFNISDKKVQESKILNEIYIRILGRCSFAVPIKWTPAIPKLMCPGAIRGMQPRSATWQHKDSSKYDINCHVAFLLTKYAFEDNFDFNNIVIDDGDKIELDASKNWVECLADDDLEDLVYEYMLRDIPHDDKAIADYRMYPSSCKLSEQKYEFLVESLDRQELYTCQVKNQNQKLNINDYLHDAETKYTRIYLFSGKGYINKGKKSAYIKIIDPKDLFKILDEQLNPKDSDKSKAKGHFGKMLSPFYKII